MSYLIRQSPNTGHWNAYYATTVVPTIASTRSTKTVEEQIALMRHLISIGFSDPGGIQVVEETLREV
tara:strand:- start:773 stop:973 length:201 start_codon:yes stop_codon:yes gene_type:complete